MEVKLVLPDEYFELFYGFVYGFKKAGHPESPFMGLAKEIVRQTTPQAQKLYGFEFEKTMAGIDEAAKAFVGANVLILPVNKGSEEKN